MSLQKRLLIGIGLLLIAFFGALEYHAYHATRTAGLLSLQQQADRVHAFIMSMRRIYQAQFLKSGLALNDKTVGFLPAHALNRISDDYAENWDLSGFSFNTVSDRPRNPNQGADTAELKAMAHFRANREAPLYFQPVKPDGEEAYYLYARPLWVEKTCLRCHGDEEDAPPSIKKSYARAFDYKVGDLRGLLSIKLPFAWVEEQATKGFWNALGIHLIAIVAIYLLILMLVKKYMTSPLERLTDGMEVIAAGNYSQRIDGLEGEFAHLAQTYNAMGENLEKHLSMLEESEEELRRLNWQLEERVADRTAELEQSLEALKNTQSQLVESEKMASLGALVAGVAHEINTPVGNAFTASTFLRTKSDEVLDQHRRGKLKRSDFETYLDASRELEEAVVRNLQRAADLVRSFKQVAVDQTSEERRIFLLKEYVEEVLISLRPHIRKENHRIEVTIDDAIEVDGYPGAFSQVVTNLVMNALRHGLEGRTDGCITLEGHLQAGRVLFICRDDGRGMPAGVREKLFDPFFTTKRGKGGSGLGMHIVYNLVTQKLGGRITCQSAPGEGATFTITLPASVMVG